jgi:hypothetical protein
MLFFLLVAMALPWLPIGGLTMIELVRRRQVSAAWLWLPPFTGLLSFWVPPLAGLWVPPLGPVGAAGALAVSLGNLNLLSAPLVAAAACLRPHGPSQWRARSVGVALAGWGVVSIGAGCLRAVGVDLGGTTIPVLSMWALPCMARVGTARLASARSTVAVLAGTGALWIGTGHALLRLQATLHSGRWMQVPESPLHDFAAIDPTRFAPVMLSVVACGVLWMAARPAGREVRAVAGWLGHAILLVLCVGPAMRAAALEIVHCRQAAALRARVDVPAALDLRGDPPNGWPSLAPLHTPPRCLWIVDPAGRGTPGVPGCAGFRPSDGADDDQSLVDPPDDSVWALAPGLDRWPDGLVGPMRLRLTEGATWLLGPQYADTELVRPITDAWGDRQFVAPLDGQRRARVRVRTREYDHGLVYAQVDREAEVGDPLHDLIASVVRASGDTAFVLEPGWSVANVVRICVSVKNLGGSGAWCEVATGPEALRPTP